jgi:hypothetical protein
MIGKKILGIVGCWVALFNSGGVYAMQEVKIAFDKEEIKYTTCCSAQEMKSFIFDCISGDTVTIGNDKKTLDEAVKTIFANTVTKLEKQTSLISSNEIVEKISDIIKEETRYLIATLAWIGFQDFAATSPDTSGICNEILKKLASTNYDKANFILLSQCKDKDNYIPRPDADWQLIGAAIHILRNEKNGNEDKAKTLLKKLKGVTDESNKVYEPILGDWKEK